MLQQLTRPCLAQEMMAERGRAESAGESAQIYMDDGSGGAVVLRDTVVDAPRELSKKSEGSPGNTAAARLGRVPEFHTVLHGHGAHG